MKKLLLIALSALVITACGEEETKAEQPTVEATKVSEAKIPTKADFAKYVDTGVEYDVNEKGVLIFAKPKDMFDDFNDFQGDEITILKEKPLSIRISKLLSDDPLEPYKEWNERAFMYAVYKTFTYTPVNEITLEAYPIAENAKGKKTALKKFTLKGTITREKALDVLKKYTSATSFNDLVQLEEKEGSYRRVGVSGSDLWDKFYHNEKERSAIIEDLIK